MTHDPATLFTAVGYTGLMVALAMTLLGADHRLEAGFGAWRSGLAIHGTSMLAFGLRPAINDVVSIFATTGLGSLALLVLLAAANRLRGRRSSLRPPAAIVVVAMVLIAWYTLGDPNPSARVAVNGAVVIMLQALILAALVGGRSEERSAAFDLLLSSTAVGLAGNLLRAYDVLLGSGAGPHEATGIGLLQLLAIGGFYVGSGVSVVGIFEARARRGLERVRDELEALASTDHLTSLANRRAFTARLEEEVQRARRYGRPLALVLLDVDDFKAVNDRYGHPTGDLVLQHLADMLFDEVRSSDMAARIGGEEFALILAETGRNEARELADRLRERVEASPLRGERVAEPLGITLSLGVCERNADDDSDTMLRRADRALYQAKNGGRNRTVMAS